MHNVPASLRVRRGFIQLAFLVLFVGLAVRLAWIQVYQHDWLAKKAEGMERGTMILEAQRGHIVDRNGHSLAVTVRAPSVCINPREISDDLQEDVAQKLAEILDVDARRLLHDTMNKTDAQDRPRYFAWVKRKVSAEEGEAVEKAALPGVYIREERKRQYPGKRLLCHVLGFVNVDGQGLEGVEAAFNHVLAGQDGLEQVSKDGRGRIIGRVEKPIKPAVHGRSVYLTIDARVQRIVEEELAEACKQHRPDGACVVVMDPWTGDILAMADWPSYDPNKFNEVPHSALKSMAVCDCVEPGSSFKPFVAAAALEHGVVSANTMFNCHQGAMRIGARTLHDVHGYGMLSVRDIIAYSSNIGMAQIGERLGAERMRQALSAFGFGRKTGIELPGESAGLLNPLNKWSKLTITSIPMGQEIAVSALQLTAGFCIFANGGYLVRPRLVLAFADKDGHAPYEWARAPEYQQVLSKRTADLMGKDMLAGVVEYGTAKAVAIDGYTMSGKTGTAQIARTDGRGYEPGAYTAVFAAFAPVDQPRVVIAMITKHPKGGAYYGGVVSAPPVARMTERILSTYRIDRVATEKNAKTRAVAARR